MICETFANVDESVWNAKVLKVSIPRPRKGPSERLETVARTGSWDTTFLWAQLCRSCTESQKLRCRQPALEHSRTLSRVSNLLSQIPERLIMTPNSKVQPLIPSNRCSTTGGTPLCRLITIGSGTERTLKVDPVTTLLTPSKNLHFCHPYDYSAKVNELPDILGRLSLGAICFLK